MAEAHESQEGKEQDDGFQFRDYQRTAIATVFLKFGVPPAGPPGDDIVREHARRVRAVECPF